MNRMIVALREAPKSALTAFLLTLLAAAWLVGSGFAPNAYVPETGEELYLPAGSPLAAVLDGLAAESGLGFALPAGRPVHLFAAGRFVASAAPAAIADPAAEEFLVRLYMFASELAAECDRRRVDPAPFRHALDAMAEALRVGGAAPGAATAAAPPPDAEPASETPAVALAEPAPAPAPEPAPAVVAAAPEAPAPAKKESRKAAKKNAAADATVAKRSAIDGGGKAEKTVKAAQLAAAGKTAGAAKTPARRELAALIADDVAPDRILKASDRIVESLDVDLGFLVR